jgi:hypothetical protein
VGVTVAVLVRVGVIVLVGVGVFVCDNVGVGVRVPKLASLQQSVRIDIMVYMVGFEIVYFDHNNCNLNEHY